MSYSLGMSHIDEAVINVEKIREYCSITPNLVFDDTKSWSNVSDFLVLYKKGEELDWICDFNNNDTYTGCTTPNTELFVEACKLADSQNLYIYGEENEVYWIPKIGMPDTHIDFQEAKEVYAKYGNLDSLIENQTM